MTALNKRLARHCFETPFSSKCLLMHERATIVTGKAPGVGSRVFHPTCEGNGIMDLLEKELDKVMVELVDDEGEMEEALRQELIGKGKGLALALATIRNPMYPQPDKETDGSMARITD